MDAILETILVELNKVVDLTPLRQLAISTEQIEKGFLVSKVGKTAKILYKDKTDFCVAVAYLTAHIGDEAYEISGHSDFDKFSLMLDLSQDMSMRVDNIKNFIRYAAIMGYNQIQLYIEDNLCIKDEPYMGHMRGRYTDSDIRQLDQYCKLFDIELVPNIQTLAHLKNIADYADYIKHIDFYDTLMIGEDKTYRFIENVIKKCSELYSSRTINIGMDEAVMFGFGKYYHKHGYTDRTKLFMSHLKKVLEICEAYGFRAQMWGDIFYSTAYAHKDESAPVPKEVLELIPNNVEVIFWEYAWTDFDKYDQKIKKYKALTNNVSYAGCVWDWTGFVPQNLLSIKAAEAAIGAAEANRVKNFMVTKWGDNDIFDTLPALFYNSSAIYGFKDVDYKLFELLAESSWADFMLLDTANTFNDGEIGENNCHQYFLYNDILYGIYDSFLPPNANDRYMDKAKMLLAAEKRAGKFAYLFRLQRKLCEALGIKAELSKELKNAYDSGNKVRLNELARTVIPDCIQRIDAFSREYQTITNKNNQMFGFELKNYRLGGLKERLAYAAERISDYLSDTLSTIEELNADRLPCGYYDKDKPREKFYMNSWNHLISPIMYKL